MNELYERVTVMGEDLTVSLIVWRRFRTSMPGLVERTLDINPGLADVGHYLPVGTTFLLPIPAPRKPAVLPAIKLW